MDGRGSITRGAMRFEAIPQEQMRLALRVRHQVYVVELGYPASKVLDDEFDKRAQHFVALNAQAIPVASMRILHAKARPFEFESFLEVPQLEVGRAIPAEISRLCAVREYRTVTRTQFVHAGMWSLALQYAASTAITDFWIWTEPTMEKLYTFLGFAPVSGLTFRHAVLGKEYQVMRLCLADPTGNQESRSADQLRQEERLQRRRRVRQQPSLKGDNQ